MASTYELLSELFTKASKHFEDARPMIPMYIHLLLSALFPIYTGAHASLSRPLSAAKPEKAKKSEDSEDEDEDEDKVQKMEGMTNKDAIVLPVTAGLVLAGLYFLIMKYGADLINLVLGWYFSGVGVYSVGRLVNDGLNILVNIAFPTYYAKRGSLWQMTANGNKAVGDEDVNRTSDMQKPSSWSVRRLLKQKYTVKAFLQGVVDLRANVTIVNAFSALFGLGTIIYVNTVSKPWYLTNLQGFAVSYSALQLMSPTTFATGSLILGALFCYDIWAVFFTPLMVTVAKNLDQPIKLVFPRPAEPSATPGEPQVQSFSMLGLGDIVLPGIMIGLALRFDLYHFYLKKQTTVQKPRLNSQDQSQTPEVIEKTPYVPVTGRWGDRLWTLGLPSKSLPVQLRSSFPKPYFTASMIGYVVGMLTTLGVMSVFQHAQPALLYLVPSVLISLWGTALVRRELKEMWEFSEALTGEQLAGDSDKKDKTEAVKDDKAPKGLFERLCEEIWVSSKQAEQPTEADQQAKEASKSSNSSENKEAKDDSSEKDENMIFSFSIARHHPEARNSSAVTNEKRTLKHEKEATHSPSRSDSSEDAVVVSPDDLDGAKNSDSAPRYRTRSARS